MSCPSNLVDNPLESHLARPSNPHYARVSKQPLRKRFGDDALAAVAITAIRAYRAKINFEQNPDPQLDVDRPLRQIAYVIRQLKRPEEIAMLRQVYGRHFVLVSAFATPTKRISEITDRECRSRHGQISHSDAAGAANSLVSQDSRESSDMHGQNVQDAFPLADVIVNTSSQEICEAEILRFIKLLFGSNRVSPSRDEFSMHLAHSAALRSSDLSRQVGCAILSKHGNIISLGTNEVPAASGGQYWAGDQLDARDHILGSDKNDERQFDIFVDLITRLHDGGHLSANLLDGLTALDAAKHLVSLEGDRSVNKAMVMDLLEFGRVIHAEMAAITDAARRGLSVEGATLYCTTFPCHMCAKHIVASGVDRVVYVQPYPKSYASQLHEDSIVVDDAAEKRVKFETFIGILPIRYRTLFERKRKRKDAYGSALDWLDGSPRPNIESYEPTYSNAEQRAAAIFAQSLDIIRDGSASPNQII